MKILKKWLLALPSLALALGVAPLHAQTEGKVLTLKDCIQYSLQNHPSNAVYDNNIKLAKQQSVQALSNYLPQVNGTGTLDDNVKRQTTVIPGGGPFGPNDIKVQFGNKYATGLSAEADQVIYNQALLNSLQGNKPNQQMAELNKAKNNDDLAYNTATAYYQVMIYKEQGRLLAENEKRLNEVASIQKLQYEKGVLKKVDYDRIQVNLNSVKAQETLNQTNMETALNQLKNAMGLPLTAPLTIVDSIDYNRTAPAPVLMNPFDVKSTIDFQLQSKAVTLQEIDLKYRKAAYLPTLSGYARYGAQAYSNEFSAQYKHWYDYAAVGLRLNVPIFSGLEKYSEIKQSQLKLANARLNLQIISNNVEMAILNSNTQLMSSYTTLQANKDNLALAKDVLANTSLQYQKGVASSADLLNSDFSYKQAQTDYINSLFSYLMARIGLERSKGTITQYINQL